MMQWREPPRNKARNLVIALMWIAAMWAIGIAVVLAGVAWIVMNLVG